MASNRRRLGAVLVAVAITATACGTGASSTPFDVSTVPAGEPIIAFDSDAGECGAPCAATTALFADGRVERSLFGTLVWEERHDDVAQVIAEIDATSPDDLITGQQDCGREVDGSGSVLTFAGVVVDTCLYELDRDHPLLLATRQLPDSVGRIEPLRWTQVDEAIAIEAVDRLSQLEVSPWPERFSPSECAETYSVAPDQQGNDRFIAISVDGEFCEVWFDDVGEVPISVCQIPRSYPVQVQVVVPASFFLCPGS